MEISFEHKPKDEGYIRSQLGFIIKGFVKKLNIPIPSELRVVNGREIKGLDGSIEYHVSNNSIKYIVKLNELLPNKTYIQHQNSELYSVLYHELCHIKNIHILSEYIDVEEMPYEIIHFHTKDEMAFNLGCVLWGEFYAYTKQFKQYKGQLDEQKLFKDFENIASSLIAYKDVIHTEPEQSTPYLNETIYQGLYAICTVLAYKTASPTYDYIPFFLKIQKLHRVPLLDYINHLYNALNQCIEAYPEAFNKKLMAIIGEIFMKYYELLHIDISFANILRLNYDENQPFMKWYNEFSNR